MFVLYINGCDTQDDEGNRVGCGILRAAGNVFEDKAKVGPLQMTKYEQVRYQNELRERLQKRTGQHLYGWTLEELMALETELDSLEEQKKQAAKTAQAIDPTQVEAVPEASQSQSAQAPVITDEGPHKKEPGRRNAPSSSYDSYEDYDESYYDEPTISEIHYSRDLNGRWRHQSNGEVVYISDDTGTFEAFSSTGQKFADLGIIGMGDIRFYNIRSIGSFSELDDMYWLGGYLLEIKNTVGDEDFSDIAALWRCSPTIFVLDGYTEEPLSVEVESGARDAVIILLPDGDTFMLSTSGARTLQELQNNFTYYRVK